MNNTREVDPLKIYLHETSIDLMDNLKIIIFFIDGWTAKNLLENISIHCWKQTFNTEKRKKNTKLERKSMNLLPKNPLKITKKEILKNTLSEVFFFFNNSKNH